MTAARDRSEYQKEYYEKNKSELAERRRDRYAEDPTKRKKAIEASRKYRREKAKERERLRAQGVLPPARRVGPRKPDRIKVGGTECDAYTITTLALRIGRSVDTVNNWINKGKVPKTPFRSKRGDRLYTDAMILVVKRAIQSEGILGKNSGAYDKIYVGWIEIGVRSE